MVVRTARWGTGRHEAFFAYLDHLSQPRAPPAPNRNRVSSQLVCPFEVMPRQYNDTLSRAMARAGREVYG